MKKQRKQCLLNIPYYDWPQVLEEMGEKPFRADQLRQWVFLKNARHFSEMTNMGEDLRKKLESKFEVPALMIDNVASSQIDGTRRFFFRTKDHLKVSCVYLPNDDRSTICLSTQVGCAWECRFCASGLVKFRRNLTPGEILDQILLVQKVLSKRVDSLLFMGMGEPLANYENLLTALKVIRSEFGLNFGARHVTISTCGLVPQLEKLTEEAPKVNLAISLHAAFDDIRKRLLPKASKWTIKELIHSVKNYSIKNRMRVGFEYILIKDVNDSDQDAKRLANLLRGPAQHGDYWVNLIAYNPVPGLKFKAPDPLAIEKFQKILITRHVPVRLRKPQGVDIGAGCGQLGEAR